MKKKKGRSDVHRHPPRSSARRQDLEKAGVGIITTLYTVAAQRPDRHLCRQGESKKRFHSRVSRIYSHQPGWDLWLFYGTKKKTNTIEMILLLKGKGMVSTPYVKMGRRYVS